MYKGVHHAQGNRRSPAWCTLFQLKDANAEEDWFAFRTVDIAGDPVIAYATRLVYGRTQDVGCLGILGGYLDV